LSLRFGTDGLAPAVICVETALQRARALAASGERRILGIAGMPGASKSTLARRVSDELAAAAVYVPMDGFHLANHELLRLGRRDRKGAVDTFDAAGFVHLLRRLRAGEDDVVYAPSFLREIEEPIAGWIPVPADVPLVVTEGNYLLACQKGWERVRPLLDEAWYVEVAEETRLQRLITRHRAFGKSEEDARRWTLGSDQTNAQLVRTTRDRADVVVRID
jgi:pantothenate kinase